MAHLRLLFDNFTLALLAVIAIATFLPCEGQGAVIFGWATTLAIALLFFMHGAKLSREAILAGAGHWRLHLLVFACTFVMFPLRSEERRVGKECRSRRPPTHEDN